MINIPKTFGVQVDFKKMKSLESFLTNFNKLVNSGGKVRKYMFQFNLPVTSFQ